MRAPDALRWRCHAATSVLRTAPLTDAPIETLPAQHADLDLHHVQPTGVLGCVMKLQPLKNAVCFGCRECFVQGPGGVGRKIVHDDTDLVRMRIVDIGQIAHAHGKILRGSLICHLHMAPGSVRIKKHEQIGGAITTVFTIVTLQLTRLSWDRLAHLADQLCRTLIKANHRALRISLFGIEIKYVSIRAT